MLDLFRIDWLRGHAVKGQQMPKPIKVPRPNDPKRNAPKRMSMRDFARSMMRR